MTCLMPDGIISSCPYFNSLCFIFFPRYASASVLSYVSFHLTIMTSYPVFIATTGWQAPFDER